MAQVYWIRLAEHTDMMSQGYIGYTSKTAEERFEGHWHEKGTTRRSKSHISKALRKYGRDGVILQVLCICDEAYGLWLENKLRPADRIGWNSVAGGGLPPNHTGRKLSPERVQALRERMKGKRPPEHAQPIATAKRMMKRHASGNNKISRRWWDIGACIAAYAKFISDIPRLEAIVRENPMRPARECFELFGVEVPEHIQKVTVNRLRDGWKSEEDEDWLMQFRDDRDKSPRLWWYPTVITRNYCEHDIKKFGEMQEYISEFGWTNPEDMKGRFQLLGGKKRLMKLRKMITLGWVAANDKDYQLFLSGVIPNRKQAQLEKEAYEPRSE